PDIYHKKTSQTMIHLHLKRPIQQSFGPFFIHLDQTIYFPKRRDHFLAISEVMAHYLLLYNLSMLSRYENEWWGDLLMKIYEIDFQFISHFLDILTLIVIIIITCLLYFYILTKLNYKLY